MALPLLADVSDLTARGITGNETMLAAFLAAASAAVRDAARGPITRGTFTVKIGGTHERWLTLPGQPVVDVEETWIDDAEVFDWKLVNGSLWRARGWQDGREPSEVTVTLTGGLVEVPEDIVDLICALVGGALSRAEQDGYSSRGDLVGTRIDDYSEQYASATEDRTTGPLELPPRTRAWLRQRFSNGASVVGMSS